MAVLDPTLRSEPPRLQMVPTGTLTLALRPPLAAVRRPARLVTVMRLVVLRLTVLPKPRSSPGGVGGMGVGSGSGSGGMPTSDGMVTESSSASVVEPSVIQPLAGLGLRWMTRL